jgi:type IX secretion system PorP/SprF family membrane protein
MKFHKYKAFFTFVLVYASSALLKAQDPVFSQFYSAPILLNPAFAGNRYSPSLAINYRLQWPGLSSIYNTFSIGYDQYFDGSKIAVGLNILSDDAGQGTLKNNKISGIVGYRLSINENTFIKGGVDVSFVQRRLNWQKLIFYDALEANGTNITPGGSFIPSAEQEPAQLNNNFLDISTGLLFYNPKWFAGVTLNHVNKPQDRYILNAEQNYIGLPLRWTLQAGYQYKLHLRRRETLPSFVSPNLIYTRQAGFSQLNIGAYSAINQLIIGAYYRQSGVTGDAAIITAGIRTEVMKLTYSFDYTLSDITVKEGGSHEVAFSYYFGDDVHKRSKINDCLNLFR